MAKIYEWTLKGQTGKVVADNMKDAKREVAKKFGNAIKIPKGTSIVKVGLTKMAKTNTSNAVKEIAAPVAKRVTQFVPEVGDEGYRLTKETSFTNVTFSIDGNFVTVCEEAEFIAPKGAFISCLKNLK